MVATDGIWSEVCRHGRHRQDLVGGYAATVATDRIWSEGMPPRAPRAPRIFLGGRSRTIVLVGCHQQSARRRIDGDVEAATIVEVGANEGDEVEAMSSR